MNNSIKFIFACAVGAAAGSFVTWRLLKTKYEQIAQEEIDSVKDIYNDKIKMMEETIVSHVKEETEEIDNQEETMEEMHTILKSEKYVNYSNNKKGDSKHMSDKPYVISPVEFGEDEDYETVTLTYYADGILTDEENVPIDDVDYIVGLDSLNHFGEYEEDAVHVRNEELMGEYEILRDLRRFADVIISDRTDDE